MCDPLRIGNIATNVMPARMKPIATTASISRSENPRCLFNGIWCFSGKWVPHFEHSVSRPVRQHLGVSRIPPANNRADTRSSFAS